MTSMCMSIGGKSISLTAALDMTATISYTTSHLLSAFSWAEHKRNPLFFANAKIHLNILHK